MNPVAFSIGSLEIKWYSLCILLGAILAYILILKEAKKFKINEDFIFNLFFYTLIFGILGARLYYVLFNWNLYASDIPSIFAIWNGGLAIHGGIIAGLITIYIYTKKHNVRFLKILDIIAPGLLIAQAIGRWGNFFNQEAHGAATTILNLQEKFIPRFIIEGMNINGIYYEPTFYYESIWCVLGFIILLVIRRKKNIKVGTICSLYLIWYGLGRFAIESMRTDSLMLGPFKVAQIVSIAMVLIGIIIIILNFKKSKYEDLYNNY